MGLKLHWRSELQVLRSFVVSTFTLALYVFGVMFVVLVTSGRERMQEFRVEKLIADYPLGILVVLYTACMIIPLASLVGYHTWLIVANVTTNEHMTRSFDQKTNPYDLGFKANLRQFLFTPQEPSTQCQKAKVVDTAVARSF